MQQTVDDQMPDLTCQSLHPARLVCISSNCTQYGLICMRQDCQGCQTKHRECHTYRINSLLKKLKKKRQQANADVIKSCELMKNIYDQAVEQISKSKQQIDLQMEMYGLNEHEAYFYKIASQGRLSEVNGQITSQAVEKIEDKQDINLSFESVNRYWKKNSTIFNKIFNNFRKILGKKYNRMDSNITDQTEMIQGFLHKQVSEINLLYRASQHNFNVSKFHQLCDGIQNTLVIALTQHQKIIGGFTPLKWNNTATSYIQDTTNLSFLFSISLAEKFTLKSPQHAIYLKGGTYGPTFGGGHDLHISANPLTPNSSYTNLGHSYNLNGKYVQNQTATFSAFTGSTTKYCQFRDYQVFHVKFA